MHAKQKTTQGRKYTTVKKGVHHKVGPRHRKAKQRTGRAKKIPLRVSLVAPRQTGKRIPFSLRRLLFPARTVCRLVVPVFSSPICNMHFINFIFKGS